MNVLFKILRFLRIIFCLCVFQIGLANILNAQNNPRPHIYGPYNFSVNSKTGNLFYERQDLYIPGQGLSIDLTFSYNSVLDTVNMGFGEGWTFLYNMSYEKGDSSINIFREDGRVDSFRIEGINFLAPKGVYDHLEEYSSNQFKLTTKFGLQYFFDDPIHKKLTRVKDNNANTLNLGYNDQKLVSITNPSSRYVTLKWTGKYLSSIIDYSLPATRKIEYSYAGDKLVQVMDPVGDAESYIFDNDGKMIGMVDKNGNPLSIEYNGSGNVSRLVSCNVDNRFSYLEKETFHVIKSDDSDQITHYIFDDLDRLIELKDPSGYSSLFTYDGNDRMVQYEDKNGNIHKFKYDSKGNLLSSTNPLGHRMRYTYEPLFNGIKTITNRNGSLTTFQYDNNGNLTAIFQPLGYSEVFTYDSHGNLKSSTDADNSTTSYDYDPIGNLIKVTSARGIETYEYDSAGNRIKIINALAQSTHIGYNEKNQVTSTTNHLGKSFLFEYDAKGNLIQKTDPNSNQYTYVYDPHANLISVITPESITNYEYNGRNQLLKVTDGNSHETHYKYNQIGQLMVEIDGLGNKVIYEYDALGNLVTKIEPNGNEVNFSYDAVNRLTRRSYAGDEDNYAYDAEGNIINAYNSQLSLSFSYDGLNRLISKTYDTWNKTISYTYDTRGNRSTMVDPDGGTTTYQYDDNNLLIFLTNPFSETTAFQYDSLGRKIRQDNANGTYATYNYDGVGNLLFVKNYNSSNSLLSHNTYTYDDFGNRKTMSDNSGSNFYSYDGDHRLTNVLYSNETDETYNYDAAGNIISLNKNGINTNYAYEENNQVSSMGSTYYSFDTNGNLSEKQEAGQSTSYQFDGLNRLKTAELPNGLNSKIYYGPLGNRILMVDPNEQETKFIHDDLNVVHELDSENTTLCRYTSDLRIDGWLSMYKAGNSYFYHADALGSIVGLSNENENIVNLYQYNAFGQTLSSVEAISNRYKYTGRAYDADIAIYFLRNRYYDPISARFLTKDPILGSIHNPLTQNRYLYVESNPVNFTDPFGLSKIGNTIGEHGSMAILAGSALSLFPLTTPIGVTLLIGGALLNGISLGFNLDAAIQQPTISNIEDTYASAISIASIPINLGKIGNVILAGAQYYLPKNTKRYGFSHIGEFAAGQFSNKLKIGLGAGFVGFGAERNYFIDFLKRFSKSGFTFFGETIGSKLFSLLLQYFEWGPNGPTRIHAIDPNIIRGPIGYGKSQWVSHKDQLTYQIFYENDPDFATGPAQVVKIKLPLDDNLDLGTFELSSFGFGQFTFSIPENTPIYQKRLDVRDSLGIYVDITAGVDILKNEAFWILESIDPITGRLPEDAFTGFLPVNDTTITVYNDTLPKKGEGYVSFLINPKSSSLTGDSILAEASIVFDENAPVITNIWRNVIDAGNPSSTMNYIPPLVASDSIRLTWTGIDDPGGVGVDFYDLYVSQNELPFYLYQANIDTNYFDFGGNLGDDYSFFTLATDKVGNIEASTSPAIVEIELGVDTLIFSRPSLQEYYCQGLAIPIIWDEAGLDKINIELSTNGGTTYLPIVENVDAFYESYTWQIPENISCTDCIFRISVVGDTKVFFSDQFVIFPEEACINCSGIVLEITDNPIKSNTYTALDRIISSGTVETDSIVIYKARNSITLEENFIVQLGGQFFALIEDCSGFTPSFTHKNEPNEYFKIYRKPHQNEYSIQFYLEKNDQVYLAMEEMNGNNTKLLLNYEWKPKGIQLVEMDGNGLVPGIYMVRLKMGNDTFEKEILISKPK